jgi:uncharacterized protein YacL
MTLIVLRIFFMLLAIVAGGTVAAQISHHGAWLGVPWAVWGALIGAGGGALVIAIDIGLKGFSLRGLTAATFGLAIGSLIAYLVGASGLFAAAEADIQQMIKIIAFVFFSYLGMVMALRGKDEFNLLIPYVKFRRVEQPEQVYVVDTSALIDGRIADIATTGFLDGILVIPRFVLKELQQVADSSDPLKRSRGRRGLDILNRLQNTANIEVRIHEEDVAEHPDVDTKLVHLAKLLAAKVITTDYNLNKVAEIQHVKVLNVNDLAKSVRSMLLPGEDLSIGLVREGREPDQAVGYLPDGTMIVVNKARKLIGQQVPIIVTSSLQTSAGRMIFAELKAGAFPAAAITPASKPKGSTSANLRALKEEK